MVTLFARSVLVLIVLSALIALAAPLGAKEEATVVTLTQTPCTIIEAEVTPRRYVSNSIDDCVQVNSETASEREQKVLRLSPGPTVFSVTNKDVPYPLGFWLRGKGLGRLTLPSVSGGGLATGHTKEYAVDLVPGKYLYSCPLNPTPDYLLVVE
ncbi:MAG: hypothetical protein IME99_01695 [Proteobacteria bacterium]|nr:hypothetical protein [Pseudomonadota bacterium]